MYNSNMISMNYTTKDFTKIASEIVKKAKQEIIALALMAISFVILYAILDYLFLSSMLNYTEIKASSPILKITMVFLYIIASIYVVKNSINHDNLELGTLNDKLEIDYSIHKFSIKFFNIFFKNYISLSILLFNTILSIVVLYAGGLQEYTFSTGYEFQIEMIMVIVIFVALYFLYVLIMLIFISPVPTEDYVKKYILEYIKVKSD